MLSCQNERERQILLTALGQKGIKTTLFVPEYQHYVKMLQYLPDVMFIEFPRICGDQFHFIKLIKKHKKLRNLPVIAYGDRIDEALKNGILGLGVAQYLQRPLKFSEILAIVERLLKRMNKEVDFKSEKNDRAADIALILNSATLPTQKIATMVKYVSKMMAFPFTIAKVLMLSESDKAGAADLARVIQADLVISANLLKVSNTVFFANANRRISSIKDAIVRIGFRETKRIVLSMAVMNLFDSQKSTPGFDRVDFWYHCVGGALIAERFAKRVEGMNAELVFLAGLLHDFGIIMLDEFFPEIFATVLEKTAAEAAHFMDVELAILGINHLDITKELFAGWKMPDEIAECVALYSDYETKCLEFDTPVKRLATCVGMANAIAKMLYLGRTCDQFIRPIPDQLFARVNMPRGIDRNFVDEVNRDIMVYREFLKLEKREFPASMEGLDTAELKNIVVVNVSKTTLAPPAVYLAKAGFTVVTARAETDATELNGRFDIIILWAPSDPPADVLRPLACVLAPAERQSADPGAMRVLVPTLAIVSNDSSLPYEPSLAAIAFMPAPSDLRLLDRTISNLLLGKKIAFAPYAY
jgi:HD-like signal output (HDOD) protein/CheY-like chemotaxis protein